MTGSLVTWIIHSGSSGYVIFFLKHILRILTKYCNMAIYCYVLKHNMQCSIDPYCFTSEFCHIHTYIHIICMYSIAHCKLNTRIGLLTIDNRFYLSPSSKLPCYLHVAHEVDSQVIESDICNEMVKYFTNLRANLLMSSSEGIRVQYSIPETCDSLINGYLVYTNININE